MRDQIIVYINGKKYTNIVDPMERVSSFLQRNGLTGTKSTCKEGGCGACTVLQSTWENGTVHYKSLLGCLAPIVACDMTALTTIEGLGDSKNPHIIQQHFSTATQCGYCTPGFIMSVYAECLNGKPDAAKLRRAVDGNLCRCTGYNTINKALTDIEETVEEIKAPVFPEELKVPYESVIYVNKEYQGEAYKNEITLQATSYEEIQQFVAKYGICRFISGCSDMMVEVKFTNKMPRYICSLIRLHIHDYISLENGILKLGSQVTINDFEEFIKKNHPKAY